MLLEEDPATLIRATVQNFAVTPDKAALKRLQDSTAVLNQARELRFREAESSLKKLSRQLNTVQSQYEELTSQHSSAAHASEMARLDTQKFRTAKAASDLEVETERLSSQAADLAARLQELELQGVEGEPSAADPVEDEVLLRLKVYRSLGIELEREGEEWSRAVIRNDRKGDVHVVNMDKKFSRFFYANYFWSTL
ncbi:kinetochore protein SPC24 [Pyricularia oryzae 70-15]|uniref:Kinetochore protein Spc24 n=3 Tax=Pyricularia oryzae TaxID=318829 RepID=G4N573_PYRO7|nr:kinetochore protein SPC24 [Pyricularia oryzae 70-15]EHA52131.1 kinetochore protein SPC24 [Pyricularia oryzae 70-15]ELQ40011.1 hypothetical protein OOU_Y34scaffold00464g93 [Pyricularia oryzae Y34]KAI7919918.1 kinetochore protein SPC24 [Pyricularia oryzae]KAI7928463.1 kinetochore protein SPC24 [Pyricularia oryzae]